MRIARRTLTILVILLPLTTVLVLGFLMVHRYYRTAERNLAAILETEATRALGREVRVGKITLEGGYAYLDDVRIAEGRTLAERGAIARARQVILDFDLSRILLEESLTIPRFATARVIDPVVHVARDRAGRWNFADLFKPRVGPPTRPLVGRVQVLNGIIDYEDAALPRNPERSAAPLHARAVGIGGHLLFYADNSISWTAEGQGATGQVKTLTVLGTYEPDIQRLFLQINAERAALPLLADRFLPPDTRIAAGFASGKATFLYTPRMRGDLPFDLQAHVRVEEGMVFTRRLAEPVRGITGEAMLSNTIATVRLDADFAGSGLHAEGTVVGRKAPTLNGWATGSDVQLQRVLTALNLRDRYPALRQIAVTADPPARNARAGVRAEARGPLSNLSLRASGPVEAQGRLPKGPSVPEPGRLQVAFSGSLESPRVQVTGTLPRVRFQEYEARDVWVSGVYAPKRASADFTARVADGHIAGRVLLRPNGPKTGYDLTLRARRVNLARLPGFRIRGSARTPNPEHRLSGVAHVDLIAQGRFDQPIPRATLEVQASGLKFDEWAVQSARARLRTVGDLLYVEPAIVRDAKGFAVVQGRVDLRKETLDLHAEADEINLATFRLPQDIAQIENQKSKIENSLEGFVYLREGRITGTLDDPRFSGELYGYSLAASEQARVDYAEASVEASKQAVVIAEGQAWRFPAHAVINGAIRRPLAEDAQIDLTGRFEDVGLHDIADLVGSKVDVTGEARGTFRVRGSLRNPEVVAENVTVERASVGDYLFDTMTTSLRYDPNVEQGTWFLSDFRATLDGTAGAKPRAILTASARLTNDRRFSVDARADNVDLNLLEPFIADYATVEGTATAAANLSGVWREGKAEDLTGTLTAQTTGFTINAEQLGDLYGKTVGQPVVLTVRNNAVTSDGFSFGTDGRGIDITALRYDLDSRALEVDGTMRGFRIERIKRVLTGSPYVAANPDSAAARWLQPLTDPLSGTLHSDSIQVRGTSDDPNVRFTWRSDDMVIGPQKIDAFQGTLNFNRKVATLETARMEAGETIVTANGTLVAGQTLSGELEMYNLPMETLKQWFPGRPQLESLAGTVDFVSITASGRPAAPVLTASAEVREVAWRDPKGEVLGGRLVQIERVSVSQAIVREGEINVEDVRVALADQPASTTPLPEGENKKEGSPPLEGETGGGSEVAPTALRRYEASASGSVEFSWQSPFIPEDPKINLEVRIGGRRAQDPGEDLGILNAFLPGPKAELGGKIKALFTWTGTVRQPQLYGTLSLKQEPGDRLRFAHMTTVLSGLDAGFTFTGDRIRVDRFIARSQIINPRNNEVVATSEPIEMTGALTLDENAADKPSIRLTTPRLIFAEAPLPLLGSGRAVGELHTEDLTIGGTLARPIVSGTVSVRQADFRMPVSFETTGTNVFVWPIQPTFALNFVAGESVRIGAAQLTAYVRTEPGRPIELTGDLESPRINGALLVERGTLIFPTARFAIQRGGEVALRYPSYDVGDFREPGLGIFVDLTATTRLTAESVNGVRKRYTITVEARGPLNSDEPLDIVDPGQVGGGPLTRGRLRLTFRSDPPDLALSATGLQQRVTGLLGGEAAIRGLFRNSRDVGRILSEQLSDVISASFLPELFERIGIARALGFEEFTVEASRLDVFTLRLSRQLFGPLYASYWQRLSGEDIYGESGRWEFKLSYRLPLSGRALFLDFVQFSWTLNEQRTNAYLVEGVFRF